MLDKNRLLDKIVTMPEVVLELGCGNKKIYPESIGIDLLDYACVDFVGDVLEVFREFPDQSVDRVYSSHFLEHVENIDTFMKELGRIAKDNAQIEFVVPHFSNPYFYSDYTHKNFFGLYSFSYFCKNKFFSRPVPNYNFCQEFELLNVELIFKAAKPFYFRYLFKKIIGTFFNLNRYSMELYEESFCYIFPCYEILFVIKKNKSI